MTKFHPNLDDDCVKEDLPFFDLEGEYSLCGMELFHMYNCIDCLYGTNPGQCILYYDQNPHLQLFVAQLKLAHPELFI